MFLLIAATLFQLVPTASQSPYKAPQITSSQKQVVLAFGSGKALYVATSNDDGRKFSEPVKVVDADILPLGHHSGPRIAISKNAIVVTAVVGSSAGEHGKASDGDLFAWRSVDGGKTWSKGVKINDVPSAPREALHTLASDKRGNLFAAWLDLRKEGTRLYGAFSRDAGKTWSKNILVYESPDGTICQCCHPSAAYASDGSLDVMWRNSLGGSRDFYLAHSVDGRTFGKAVKLGEGTWKINMCPMDGGGIAHDGKRTLTAWRREMNIFLAEPGKPESKLGDGKDVTIAAGNGHVYTAWVSRGQVQLWRDGKTEELAEKGTLPSITVLADGSALAAWEHEGGIAVKRID